MADKKRKNRDDNNNSSLTKHRNKKNKSSSKGNNNNNKTKPNKGPRLPNILRKQLEKSIHYNNLNNIDGEDITSDEEVDDVYEYEEEVAEEETMRNKRYDPVESFEYQLPEQFDDENVASDDDLDDDDEEEGDMEGQDVDGDKHSRMLQQLTGLPAEAFSGRKRINDHVVTEAYPESEFNPTRDILEGDGHISIQDLLDPLHGKPGFGDLRKSIIRTENKSNALPAPLPKSDREKVERSVAYGETKKAITKWETLTKINREAPTLYFDEDTDVGYSTVGAIASEFEPRTEFEKKMASILNDNKVKEAHKNDGARLLELNKVSAEDVKVHQNRLAKMRSLLFRHEIKAKRIKKIKSKTYHRLQKKDRLKASAVVTEMDPEAAKKAAIQQEFNRAEERLRLKHKNSGKWAKHILRRGLDAQDEGTRAALADQHNQNALLTRKMHSLKDSSSDESSGSDDDDFSDNSDEERELKLLEKAKEKTIGIIEENEKTPNSGVLSLPFMVRGLEKRKEAAKEEAKLALEGYESSLKQLNDEREGENPKTGNSSSRRVFGASKENVEKKTNNGVKMDNYYDNSDSEDNMEDEEGNVDVTRGRGIILQKALNIDPNLLREESEIGHDSLFKNFSDIVKDPGPKTTYEVAMLASDSWKKMSTDDEKHSKNDKVLDASFKPSSKAKEILDEQLAEEVENGSDSDNEVQMVDGVLSAGDKYSYELPSQEELIRRAFAGDDVEDDFEKDKEEVLNEENPEPEKPVLLPGWGQWTNKQKRKELPSWMVEKHENAKKKRDEALKKRKDAHLKHVVISTKVDKKEEKLYTKTVPFPYSNADTLADAMRVPLGPGSNPATVVGALIRPEVVKRPGLNIQPIKYEDVDPYKQPERQEQNGGKQQKKNSVVSSGIQKKNVPKYSKNMKPKTFKV